MARAENEDVLKGMPSLARRRDLAANGKGAEIVGAKRVGDDSGTGGLDGLAEHNGILIVMGDELADAAEDFGTKASLYIHLGAHTSKVQGNAHFVLPITTHAEQEGTFTNLNGRVQRFWPGLQAPGAARPAWLVLGALAAEKGHGIAAGTAAEAFTGFVAKHGAYSGLDYDTIGTRGAVINETVSLAGD